jgi:hypothetical protein
MFIRTRHLLGFLVSGLLSLSLACHLGADGGSDDLDMTRVVGGKTCTYRFTARITDNGGVLPFRVGDTIKGTFTYDLDGRNQRPDARDWGDYKSPQNALSLDLGNLRFSGVGDIKVTVGAFKHAEHFQIVAFDLKLPDGWEMDHGGRSQYYSIVLQNAPPKGAVPHAGIPNHVSLAPFSTTRVLCLAFANGVRFPGGRVNGRTAVFATVNTLEERIR